MKEVIGTWGRPHNVLVSVENGYLRLHHFAGLSESAVSFKKSLGSVSAGMRSSGLELIIILSIGFSANVMG